MVYYILWYVEEECICGAVLLLVVVLSCTASRVLIWYQLGFSLELPQKWGFGWDGGASLDPKKPGRNPNPKDLLRVRIQ